MLKRILQIFRGRPHRVKDIASLEEGHARAVIVGDPYNDGAEIVLARVDGVVHVLDALCPHAADGHFNDGPLIEGRYVWCPAHNYRFEPQTGKAVGAVCKKAHRYRVVIDGDDCLVYV